MSVKSYISRVKSYRITPQWHFVDKGGILGEGWKSCYLERIFRFTLKWVIETLNVYCIDNNNYIKIDFTVEYADLIFYLIGIFFLTFLVRITI